MLSSRRKVLSIVLLLILSTSGVLLSQVRAGASFLKILPGARTESMASAQTAELDDIHSLFANPAGIGLLREWYGSASYTKWIADVYQASLLFNKKISNPLSRQTRFALGILYQGIPDFDSSDMATPTASANDLLISLSIGQKIPQNSNLFSIGISLKYLHSRLDTYTASSLIFDSGLIARTPRFKLGLSFLKYGIISAGVSLTQLGTSLKFDQENTPLPQTLRTGMAFYAGNHNGIQFQITGDYYKIKDDGDSFSLGAEIKFGNRFSINGGYNFNSDLMEKFSFGGSIQLDDISSSPVSFFPGRNKAARIDLATMNEEEIFGRTYRGDLKYFPNGPESFKYLTPAADDTVLGNNITLQWEKSHDPDLFDNIKYTFLCDKDSAKLANLLSEYEKNTDKFFAALSETDSSLLVTDTGMTHPSFALANLENGHYYWTVFAEDEDQHLKFGEANNRPIAHFYVPYTQLEIKDIEFEYSPWITSDDYQGEISVTISNSGDWIAKNFTLSVYDSVVKRTLDIVEDSTEFMVQKAFSQTIKELKPGQTRTVKFSWFTAFPGLHNIKAKLDITDEKTINKQIKTSLSRQFFTIPKGTITTSDSVNVVNILQTTIDLPMVTEIFFDPNDASVNQEYLFQNNMDPYLAIFAERLVNHPELKISVQGFSDPNSEKSSVRLANLRAKAVRDSLIRLGVGEEQVKILPGKVLKRRRTPTNKQDAKWVFEERRYVKITTNKKAQQFLFAPIRHYYDEIIIQPVNFPTNIKTALSTNTAKLRCFHNELKDSVAITDFARPYEIGGNVSWKLESDGWQPWINNSVKYQFVIMDSIGRSFKTHEKQTVLKQGKIHSKHRIIMPLQFANTDPVYSFYWKLCLEQSQQFLDNSNWRFRFTGHACAVGPSSINKRLSRQRVARFDKSFQKFLKTDHPNFYQQINERFDKPTGYGESKPLAVEYLSGEMIIIGNNDTPIGRKLNRRIELEFYKISD